MDCQRHKNYHGANLLPASCALTLLLALPPSLLLIADNYAAKQLIHRGSANGGITAPLIREMKFYLTNIAPLFQNAENVFPSVFLFVVPHVWP